MAMAGALWHNWDRTLALLGLLAVGTGIAFMNVSSLRDEVRLQGQMMGFAVAPDCGCGARCQP